MLAPQLSSVRTRQLIATAALCAPKPPASRVSSSSAAAPLRGLASYSSLSRTAQVQRPPFRHQQLRQRQPSAGGCQREMCYSAKCKECGKMAWGGCGAHLESVFRGVPMEQRCFCGLDKEKLPDMIKQAQARGSNGPFPRAGQGGGGCAIL
eukprot:INCI15642.1.p1 GENE.INCI15642.1~~INCI15642.1.p1  ORF type:complete len:151 (-),score=14.28 INCI15642.1:123-575(-)